MMMMILSDDLYAIALRCKGRPPSGKYIMHGAPRTKWCPRCGGYVSAWHHHHTDDEKKKDAVMAQSEWMK
jgi:hypothetical protein